MALFICDGNNPVVTRKFAFMIPSIFVGGKKENGPLCKHTHTETGHTEQKIDAKNSECYAKITKEKKKQNVCVFCLLIFPQFDNTIFFRTKKKIRKKNEPPFII